MTSKLIEGHPGRAGDGRQQLQYLAACNAQALAVLSPTRSLGSLAQVHNQQAHLLTFAIFCIVIPARASDCEQLINVRNWSSFGRTRPKASKMVLVAVKPTWPHIAEAGNWSGKAAPA